MGRAQEGAVMHLRHLVLRRAAVSARRGKHYVFNKWPNGQREVKQRHQVKHVSALRIFLQAIALQMRRPGAIPLKRSSSLHNSKAAKIDRLDVLVRAVIADFAELSLRSGPLLLLAGCRHLQDLRLIQLNEGVPYQNLEFLIILDRDFFVIFIAIVIGSVARPKAVALDGSIRALDQLEVKLSRCWRHGSWESLSALVKLNHFVY